MYIVKGDSNMEFEIKKIIKINLIIAIILILIAFFFNSSTIAFLAFGIIVSILANILLVYAVYKVVYQKAGKGSMFIDYSKRYVLYILSLYFVYKLSKRYFEAETLKNVLACSLGFFAIQISLYIEQYFKNRVSSEGR